MCGIGGVITDFPFTEKEAEMCVRLFASLDRRGGHAFGYFDGEEVFKRPGRFTDSYKFYTLADELLKKRTDTFLCHTRYATRGDPQKNENNHPFELGPFVFAHNGMLFYTDPFPNEWGIETDSFWMLYWINEEYEVYGDTVTAIQKGVKHVEGTYACWLYNREEDATYIYRMHQGVLETFVISEMSTVIFGSDWISIRDALGLKGYMPPRGARPIKPYVIYRLKKGRIEAVGRFSPLPVSIDNLRLFEQKYGHLYKYHRRIILGV